MASVGILGGTFNPPHVGHLVCAQDAWHQLGLERVVLMPVYQPPHKDPVGDAGAAQRLAMCELAAAGSPWLDVSTVEIDRGGASYTVDTLRALTARNPHDELTFIVGADMASSFRSWREPETVLELATLAVGERDGVARSDIADQLEPLTGAAGGASRVRFFDMPRLDVSSSEIRRRVGAGAPIDHLVPAAVADHIAGHGLYRSTPSRAGSA